jgi:hypothetical protein
VIRGAAPDLGAYEFSGEPPVTTIDLSPAAPDGADGWYVSPVTVTTPATDPDSAVVQTRCDLDPASVPASFSDLPNASCALGVVSADGSHTAYAASIDTEGNVETSVATATFKIDQTAPTLRPALSATTVALGQTGVTAAPHASDDTSGVASASCGAVDTSTAGVHTVLCTATDHAGNTNSATLTYVVEYRILGFFSPVPGSKWLIGQTVPVKVALAGANGTRIPDAAAVALASACRVTFSASGAQVVPAQCAKYDTTMHQFIYNWKLGKAAGPATITMTVSYADTTITTRLSEPITIVKK